MSGYDPELYAALHRGTPGDAEFYARLARGQRVLELGVGYGRLLPALAAEASRYVGLELDAGMLALAQQAHASLGEAERARSTLVRADMRDFSLREKFDRIFIPHSGLYCLESDDDVARCLERVEAHLAPEGQLVIDAYHADPFHEHSRPEDQADDHEDLVAHVTHRGVAYEVHERSDWDREAQRMEVVYRHTPVEGGAASLEGRIVHRYLLCDQLATALVAAGFEGLHFAGDFYGRWIDDEDDLMVVVAERGRG